MRMIDADALENDIRKWIKIKDLNYEYGKAVGLEIALKCVAEALAITPERKRGRWVPQDHNKKNGMITTTVYYCPTCSVCGKTGDYNMSFCPSCGADMREGEAKYDKRN